MKTFKHTICIILAISMFVISLPMVSFAYTVSTNGKATSKVPTTYMLPTSSSSQVFNNAWIDTGDSVQVFCKDGSFYLVLVPFNHNGTNTSNNQWFIGYADASKIQASGIPDASSFYLNRSEKTNDDAILYHQPASTVMKGATTNITERTRLVKDSDVTLLFEKDGYYFVRSGSVTGFIEKSKILVHTGLPEPTPDSTPEPPPAVTETPEPIPTVTETPEPTPAQSPLKKPSAATMTVDKTTITIGQSVTFSWNKADDALTYDFHISQGGTRIDLIGGISGTSYTMPFKKIGIYEVAIYSVNGSEYTRGNSLTITINSVDQEKTAYVYNTGGDNLNVRSDANISASIIGKLKANSAITIIGEPTNGFYKVKFGTGYGYSSSKYITLTKPVSTTIWSQPMATSGRIITQKFGGGWSGGSGHMGVDMVNSGKPDILAIADGEVVQVLSTSKSGGYGNFVMIKHNIGGKTFYSAYGHMKDNSIVVKVGAKVKSGQKLGVMGSTGYSSGAHLHVAVFSGYVSIPRGYYGSNFSSTSKKYGNITYYDAFKVIESNGKLLGI